VGQGGFGDRAEVIGIVGDVRYGQMEESAKPDVYISPRQSPRNSQFLHVRTTGNPAALVPAVRREVRALNRMFLSSTSTRCRSELLAPQHERASGPFCWRSSPQSR
jgi:hypothetical protein